MDNLLLRCVITGTKKRCRKISKLWIDLEGDYLKDNEKIRESLKYFKVIGNIKINGYKTKEIEGQANLLIINMVPSYSEDVTNLFNTPRNCN